jgi:hypothetical protein
MMRGAADIATPRQTYCNAAVALVAHHNPTSTGSTASPAITRYVYSC